MRMKMNSIETSNRETEQVIFRNIYVHQYIHVIAINEKETMNFKSSGIWEHLDGVK